MSDFEERQQRRRERFQELAEKAKQESGLAFARADEIASFIPPGQPILVGHHSERRHRRDLERIDRNMRKGLDLYKKAEYYEDRAKGVGRGGISSDDPDAVAKLKEKLAALQKYQEEMKMVNAAWRKAGRPQADNLDGWAKMAQILGVERESIWLAKIQANKACDYMERAPFPNYCLGNNNGNMKRIKERIKQLETREGEEATEEEIVGIKIVDNVEANRLQIFFPGKPPAEQRKHLKQWGFRWAPHTPGKPWQAYRNPNARCGIELFKEKFLAEAVSV